MSILFNIAGVVFLFPYLVCLFSPLLGFTRVDHAKAVIGGTLIYLTPSLLFFWLGSIG